MDNISVIIRTRNEEDYIGFAIQSVIDNFEEPEIIIIDNNSTDDTLDIVTDFPFTNIKIYNIDSYSPGKALNLGVQKANNDIILFLSAHCQIIQMLDFDCIEDMLKKYIAVFGKQVPIHRGKKITPRYLWSNFGNEEVVNMWTPGEDRSFLHFGFSFFEKKTLLKFPINEKLKGKEDRYWAEKIIDNGYNYLYSPDLVCNHFFTSGGSTWTKND